MKIKTKRTRMTQSDYSRRYREKQRALGRCIAGCGRKSGMRCGLCSACGNKYSRRSNERWHALHPGAKYRRKSK